MALVVGNRTLILTRDSALPVLSLWAVQRVEEVRHAAPSTADEDGTET